MTRGQDDIGIAACCLPPPPLPQGRPPSSPLSPRRHRRQVSTSPTCHRRGFFTRTTTQPNPNRSSLDRNGSSCPSSSFNDSANIASGAITPAPRPISWQPAEFPSSQRRSRFFDNTLTKPSMESNFRSLNHYSTTNPTDLLPTTEANMSSNLVTFSIPSRERDSSATRRGNLDNRRSSSGSSRDPNEAGYQHSLLSPPPLTSLVTSNPRRLMQEPVSLPVCNFCCLQFSCFICCMWSLKQSLAYYLSLVHLQGFFIPFDVEYILYGHFLLVLALYSITF